jgi:hypothetical protein
MKVEKFRINGLRITTTKYGLPTALVLGSEFFSFFILKKFNIAKVMIFLWKKISLKET